MGRPSKASDGNTVDTEVAQVMSVKNLTGAGLDVADTTRDTLSVKVGDGVGDGLESVRYRRAEKRRK
jgi:hypothetical protein